MEDDIEVIGLAANGDEAFSLAEGNTSKEIAKLLFISEGTVKNHITNILSKLYLRDRTQIALYAKKHLN